MRLRSAILAVLALAPASHLVAQPPPDSARADTVRSTQSGVYTEEQAARGKDVYLAQCQSCHTPSAFSSPDFRNNWVGKLLSEFFTYLVETMPESEPGALSKEQYAQVTAYILSLNAQPTGAVALPTSADSLTSIRIEIATPPGASSPLPSRR
jgi:S-disulfanyl-L-cysteine oxidoreductase SoxD